MPAQQSAACQAAFTYTALTQHAQHTSATCECCYHSQSSPKELLLLLLSLSSSTLHWCKSMVDAGTNGPGCHDGLDICLQLLGTLMQRAHCLHNSIIADHVTKGMLLNIQTQVIC